MALLRQYLLQNAITQCWYTEDHSKPLVDRWSAHVTDGHKFASIDDIEAEIQLEGIDGAVEFYRIVEIISVVGS